MTPDKRPPNTFKVVALLLLAGVAAAAIYAHNRAATILSDALSARAGLPVSVGLIDLGISHGVTLRDITVKNPPGCKDPFLARIKGINIRPDYGRLARGELSVGSVRVYGPEIFIEPDEKGKLNAAAALESYKAAKTGPAKPMPEFTVGLIELADGRINLPDKGISIRLDKASVEGLSNRPGSRTSFSLDASDEKSASVRLKGAAEPFSAEPETQARLDAAVGRIGSYISGPASGALKDASLEATVELAVGGASADASISGTVMGVRPRQEPEGGELRADFNAMLTYDRTADTLLIEPAEILVPELIEVGIKGRISGLEKEPVGNICVEIPDIDLNVVNSYLPAGFNISGTAAIDDVCLEGPLRPFAAEARGRIGINGLSVSRNGKGFSGAFGGAAVKYASGRLSGRYDFSLLGGGITGGFGISGDGGKFRISAVKLLLSAIEGLPEGVEGTVDAQLEGELGPGLKTIKTEYKADAGGLSWAKGKVGADSVTLTGGATIKGSGRLAATANLVASGLAVTDKGAVSEAGITAEAVSSGGAFSVSGALSASGIDYNILKKGALSGGYSYTGGKAVLSELKYEGEGLSAGVESLTAAISGNEIDVLAEGGELAYGDGNLRLGGLDAQLSAGRTKEGKLGALTCGAGIADGEAYGLALTDARGRAAYDGESADAHFGLKLSGNQATLEAKAEFGSEGLKKHRLSGNLDISNLETLGPAFERKGVGVSPSAGSLHASFEAGGEGGAWKSGKGAVKLSGLSAGTAERTLLSGVSAELAPSYADGVVSLPRATVDFGGYFGIGVSGTAEKTGEGWQAEASAELPKTALTALQEGVLEALPPKLMWADVSGEASAALKAVYSGPAGASIEGAVELAGARLDLPDMGLSIGPADGRIPLGLHLAGRGGEVKGNSSKSAGPAATPFRGEVFDRGHYPELMKSYAAVPDDADIVIEKIRYGFVELDSVTLALTPGDGFYDIDWFGLYAFDGQLVGYGRADLRGGRHALSLIMSDFSMRELCDTVPAIKGYLSGRVDGLMRIVVAGKGYEGVTGASMFWAEDGPGEEREISKEFIKKLMGSSMKKYMTLFIGDRYFDTGELEIVFSKGNLVFEHLLIANTNFFGQRDLNISVAPVSNRISIEHLLEVTRDVGERAKSM